MTPFRPAVRFAARTGVAALFLLALAACSDEAEQAPEADAAPETADETALIPAEQLEMPEIDPACLAPAVGLEGPDEEQLADLPAKGCAPALEHYDGWASWSDPQAEVGMRRPYIAARTALYTPERYIAVQVEQSGGGTGIFSSLLTGRLSPEGETIVAPTVHMFGDRCMGGIDHVEAHGTTARVFSRLTPADVLTASVDGEDAYSVAQETYGDFFGEAPFCAVCCSGAFGVTDIDAASGDVTDVGILHAPDASLGSDTPDPAADCIVDAVGAAANDEGIVPLGGFGSLRDGLKACAEKAAKKG